MTLGYAVWELQKVETNQCFTKTFFLFTILHIDFIYETYKITMIFDLIERICIL